ncbi:MAG: LuxR C-terminal-related transcriptional regulator [Galbitalea sp.]
MANYLDERRWGERLLDRARQIIGEDFDWQSPTPRTSSGTGRHDSARAVITPLLGDESAERVALSDVALASIDAVLEARPTTRFAPIPPSIARSSAPTRPERTTSQDGRDAGGRSDSRGRASVGSVPTNTSHEACSPRYSAPPRQASVPLNLRERQILGELTTLRTVEEIAHDLLLSVNTVKTHIAGSIESSTYRPGGRPWRRRSGSGCSEQ